MRATLWIRGAQDGDTAGGVQQMAIVSRTWSSSFGRNAAAGGASPVRMNLCRGRRSPSSCHALAAQAVAIQKLPAGWRIRLRKFLDPMAESLARMKPTLGQAFALSLLALAGVLASLFYVVFDGSRAAIIESSGRIRDQASREISERVSAFLAHAPDMVAEFQRELRLRLVSPRDPDTVESALFGLLLSNGTVSEITLTSGEQIGFDDDGAIELAETPRWQVSVVRSMDEGGERLWSRRVHQEGTGFAAERRMLSPAGAPGMQAFQREVGEPVSDPTAHLTFATPASKDLFGRLLWSDLHWSQIDADLPQTQRRVEVSVQQTVSDAADKFAGVLRVGLLAQQLDHAVMLKLTPGNEPDPHRIFICDGDGRLITRGVPSDRLELSGDDLRLSPASLSPEIAGALAEPRLRAVGEEMPTVSGQFRHAGEEYLTTFRMLPGTQGWIVGIVVPRAFYLGKLVAMRNRLLAVSLAIILALLLGGSLGLRVVKRAQAQISRESLKMNAFDFSPAPTEAAFRDVSDVLESLEKAKTAMRAMGKYVPVDLVRKLYRERSEPVLGSAPLEISIMFSDIKGFTTYSEQLTPNQLADALGRYLDTLSGIIQRETHGTIDKFIGDAIMTIWNAPEPVADHARMACLAAVRCRAAVAALAQTPEWRGLPPFETRFGLHRAQALVGHFGAHDRMNYTAIGDAINLASRLEGLNKQYGTTIIASEPIVEQAGEAFDFRLLDLVAVKGKSQAIKIYELLGEIGAAAERGAAVTVYERAFAAYVARDFDAAIAMLEQVDGDRPSAVLLERCRTFKQQPPSADWNGVHVATSK